LHRRAEISTVRSRDDHHIVEAHSRDGLAALVPFMRSMSTSSISSVRSSVLACAVLLPACSDDASGDGSATEGVTASDDATSTGTPDPDGDDTSGAIDTGGSDTGGSTASADDTTSADDTSGSTGDAPPVTCDVPTALPGRLDTGAWDDRFTLPGLTGRDGFAPIVRDIASDADGSVLVAGYFRWAGGEALEGLARWDEGQWTLPRPSWQGVPIPPEGFSAVAVTDGGALAAASTDLAANGDGEIWLDVGDGPEVIGQHAGVVRRLAWIGTELWAAGNFQIAGGGPSGLARWDGAQWLSAPEGAPDGPVYEILADTDATLWVGGAFSQIGGVPTSAVAQWDGSEWTPMSMPAGARVYALELDGNGTLHAGGSFFFDGSPDFGSLAQWTGSAWEIADGGVAQGPAFGAVSDLLYEDGAMLVAGCFDAVGGGDAVAAAGLASVTRGVWASLDEGSPFGSAWFDSLACGFEPDPNAVVSMQHQRLHADESGTWLVGSFGGKGQAVSRNVVSNEGGAWQAVGTAGLGVSGSIAQMALDPSTCEVVGLAYATHAGTEPLGRSVVRFDDTSGWTADSPPLPDGDCSEIVVRQSGEVVLGCTEYGDLGVSGSVLRLADGAWETIAEVDGAIQDLELAPDDAVWVAGGAEAGFVARLDEDRLTIVEDAFDLPVMLVSVAPTDEGHHIVVGGPFTSVDGRPAARIARWDGMQWHPLAEGLVSTPSAIEATEQLVYAASWDEGVPGRMVLGAFEDGTWTELGDPAHGLADPFGMSSHTFTSLLAVDDGLVAVGYVWPEDGGRNAFFFDGAQFHAIGGGVAAISVDDVMLTEDALVFGGTIAEVGSGANLRPSVGTARFVWR
jgi:hypothetical protein